MTEDPIGAFVSGEAVTADGAADGPLAGLTFAAKDVFDVAGHVTGAGNPDWRRTHEPAAHSAAAVRRMLDAGATLDGRTISDELAYSLLGVNAHDGTPANPAAPDSIPGGSSSGSAAATAAGLVDVALGTDTSGSVRVPAGLCGIYGVRPTFGSVPRDGVVGLAPSFDTVGWFARESLPLWQVATVLLGPAPADEPPHDHLLVADDVWDVADDEVVDALLPAMQRLALRLTTREVPQLAAEGLEVWADQARVLVAREAWTVHRDWLESTNPTLSLDIKQRFDAAALVTDDEVTRARAVRDQAAKRLEDLLGPTTVLALPTTPEIAPLLDSTDRQFAEFHRRTLALTCIAGLAGLPQVTIPVTTLAEYPVGLSLIGAPGTDHQLLALAATVTRPAD
jgi:amidase